MLLQHLGHLHLALFQTTFLSGSFDHGAWSSSNITMTSFKRAYPHEHLNTSCENIADFPGCLSKFLLACFPYSPERIADDPQCMEWFIDYWKYVHWNERGNECSLSEVGFGGFVDIILNPNYVMEYLLPEGCETRDGDILASRLRMLNQRYTGAR